MGMLVTLVRSGTLIVITAGLALGSTACSSVVPKDDVASVVGSELQKQGITIDAGVTCPEDLEAEVGRSVRCEFTTGGQPVDAVASVTSVQGGQANFDIVTEARPIPQALLAQQIGEQIGQDAGGDRGLQGHRDRGGRRCDQLLDRAGLSTGKKSPRHR